MTPEQVAAANDLAYANAWRALERAVFDFLGRVSPMSEEVRLVCATTVTLTATAECGALIRQAGVPSLLSPGSGWNAPYTEAAVRDAKRIGVRPPVNPSRN